MNLLFKWVKTGLLFGINKMLTGKSNKKSFKVNNLFMFGEQFAIKENLSFIFITILSQVTNTLNAYKDV